MQNHNKVQLAVNSIRERIPLCHQARIGLILGTGLGRLAGMLTEKKEIPYSKIAGFPQSTVESHAGALTYGLLGETPVWTLQGRFHLYEGYNPAQVCMGVRTLAGLGATTLVITNAAGGLNPLWPAGSLMLVADHINFTAENPLAGPNHDAWGPRFPDMSQVYTPALQELALAQALNAGIRLERGIYIGIRGPNLETPAETRLFRQLGADAIGMSTVLEAIAARHLGMDILAISCITNRNLPDCMAPVSVQEVIQIADKSATALGTLVYRVVGAMNRGSQGLTP